MPWQLGVRFRRVRKKVCLGSLAVPNPSLAVPWRREGFTGWQLLPVRFGRVEKRYALAAWLFQIAAWLSQGAAKDLRGGRVLPVRFGRVEQRYALGACMASLFGRLALPKRRGGFTGWQKLPARFGTERVTLEMPRQSREQVDHAG